MTERAIHLANAKGRDAEVRFFNPHPKKRVLMVDASGEKPVTRRVVKTDRSAEALLAQFGSPAALAQAMIAGDPEINLELAGKFAFRPSRVLVHADGKVLYKAREEEYVYDVKGELKEKREPKFLERNIAASDMPLRGGRLFPKKQIFNKFIFARKYQLRHVNGLTYDFLFDIAAELHASASMMLVGGGPRGAGPLVFQDGGTPYRAFLEGRVRDKSYCLILHLSNLELKPIPK